MSKLIAAVVLALSAATMVAGPAAAEYPDWAKRAFQPHGGNGK